MAKYDGLIIPRSYNDYINKSDPVGVQQALALTGVMDDTPTAGSSKPVKSSGLVGLSAVDVVETGNMHPVTSNAVAETAADLEPVDEVTLNNMHSVTSNAVANSMRYSTSEVNTGKKWIDGKPIYRKVVDCGALPNADFKYVNHNISNLGVIINVFVNSYTASGNGTMLPYVNPVSISGQISFTYSKTQIELRTATDYSSYVNTYAILEYTKTTDQPATFIKVRMNAQLVVDTVP